MDLDKFVTNIISKLDTSKFSPQKIKSIEENLRDKYSEIFTPIELNDLLEDGIEEIEEDQTQEERLEELSSYYENLEKSGIIFFPKSEQYDNSDLNKRLEYGQTLLHKAVKDRDAQHVILLLGDGIDSKIKDNSGNTARMIAILEGYDEIVEIFDIRGIKE